MKYFGLLFRSLFFSLLLRMAHLYLSKRSMLDIASNKQSLHAMKSNPAKSPFSSSVQVGDIVEMTISTLTNQGDGLGRKNSWVIMVPFSLVGEEVVVKITRNFDTYSEAELLRILKPSTERVDAPCKYFGRCGGCQYQHMSLRSQREWKKEQVQDLMQRIGKLPNVTVNIVVGSTHAYGYRSKLTPHFTMDSRGKGDTFCTTFIVGFQQRGGSGEIIDVSECLIASPSIDAKYKEYKAQLLSTTNDEWSSLSSSPPSRFTKAATMTNIIPVIRRNEVVVEAAHKSCGVVASTLLFRECDTTGTVRMSADDDVIQTVGNVSFSFKAGDFFQNNPHVLPLIVAHVKSFAVGDGCVNLIDAYCGAGLFALSCASHFHSVFGIDVSQGSIDAATKNAETNNIKNVKFSCGVSEQIFKRVSHLNPDETSMIIDPPRKGCDKSFLKQLFRFRPKKIVYVSCDPATQARDMRDILSAPLGYHIVDITPFDLFPQTRHIENVMTFKR